MSTLDNWIDDETPCGQCGHAAGDHYPPGWAGVDASPCFVGEFGSDACECVGWQA